MKNFPTILLTGFTGVLGKRFAYRLAEEGYEVVCLVRAGSEHEARERFQKVFHELNDLLPRFDESLETRIHPLPGDVRKKNLGIPTTMLDTLRGPRIKGIWHLAALLDLTESKSQDVYDTNFWGTLHVLEFAQQQGIAELHYFSTFGSSGKLHEGIVREIPGIRPPSFRNTYEQTKWEAERHVWQAQIRGEIAATIYRPSIVVGDSVLGRYEQFNVFNHVFDVVSRLRVKLCEQQGLDPKTAILKYDLRVLGDRNATLNIVPLDFVIDTVMKIYAVPRSLGRVYHIVNPNPPSLGLAERIFKQNEPWEGLRWELFDPSTGFRNPYEKYVAKQIGFLTPYLLGEAIYDYSNIQTVLAQYGGMPLLKNEVFLDAISKRGKYHGWQEVKADAVNISAVTQCEQLDSGFVWPEGDGLVIDFSPHHPISITAPPVPNYSMTERILGKMYRVREKLSGRRWDRNGADPRSARDMVLVLLGMGVTRRGEAEVHYHPHEQKLAGEVFARMNQVVGFDLRTYAQRPIPGHELFGHLHDHCCWVVADELVHIMRLFRDVQKVGGVGWVPRLQVLPYSAGTYLASWLSGMVSFEDMILITHQCSYLLAENERAVSLKEVERWFFNQREKLSGSERLLLKEIRQKVDPTLKLSMEILADQLHGQMELVFSLNASVLEGLIAEVRENRIGVSLAVTMSPNTAVFGGNSLEMARFRALFRGKRKIELKRVPIGVIGTPHSQRFREAARHTADLLRLYDRQGRLRDPIFPFISYAGEPVCSREDFIQAVAGIANQPMNFDRMIECSLEEGGQHFLLIQSGMSSAAGDLFEGIIRNNANTRGYSSVNVYPPAIRSREPHSICEVLVTQEKSSVPDALDQSLGDTVRWYERQLTGVRDKITVG